MIRRRILILPPRLANALEKVGVRHAIRTAVAAMATLAIANAFHLAQGYWAVITTVIVLHANMGRSLMAGWSRIVGTVMGAFFGALIGTLLGTGYVGLGVALFATLTICSAVPFLRESCRMAAITVGIVMLMGATQSLWLVGIERSYEIVLGVAVAMLTSVLVLPARARAGLRRGLGNSLEMCAELCALLCDGYLDGSLRGDAVDALKEKRLSLRLQNRQLLGEARREPGGLSGRGLRLATLRDFEVRVYENLLTMEHAARHTPEQGYHRHLEAPLTRLGRALRTALTLLAKAVEEDAPLPTSHGLSDALEAVDARLLELREQHASADHRLEDVINFHSFFHGMKEIARDLLATVRHDAETREPV
ncbi:MAG: aromatic acid exporter family protein [Desulfovibrionaceae bacterium]